MPPFSLAFVGNGSIDFQEFSDMLVRLNIAPRLEIKNSDIEHK
jgi:hypothetical protein